MISLSRKPFCVRVGLPSVLFFACTWCGCIGPSDSALRRKFREERKDFDKLVTMSNEDARLVRIAPDFTRLDNDWSWPRPQSKWGLTPQRWDEYRRLFEKTGLSRGLSRSQYGKQVFLIAYSWGMTERGVSLGYAYCGESIGGPDSLPPCEGHKDSFDGDKYRYQKIADSWYILEEH
jgi:hypothetical protein